MPTIRDYRSFVKEMEELQKQIGNLMMSYEKLLNNYNKKFLPLIDDKKKKVVKKDIKKKILDVKSITQKNKVDAKKYSFNPANFNKEGDTISYEEDITSNKWTLINFVLEKKDDNLHLEYFKTLNPIKGYGRLKICQILKYMIKKKYINKNYTLTLTAVNLRGDKGSQTKLENLYKSMGFQKLADLKEDEDNITHWMYIEDFLDFCKKFISELK